MLSLKLEWNIDIVPIYVGLQKKTIFEEKWGNNLILMYKKVLKNTNNKNFHCKYY